MWCAIFLSAALYNVAFFIPSIFGFFIIIVPFLLLWLPRLTFTKGFVWGLLVFGPHFVWLAVLLTTKSQAPWPLAVAGYAGIVVYFSLTSGVWMTVVGCLAPRRWMMVVVTVLYYFFIENYSLFIFGRCEGYPFLNPLIPLAENRWLLWFVSKAGVLVRWVLFGGALTLNPLSPDDVRLVYLPPACPSKLEERSRVPGAQDDAVAVGQRVYHKLAGINFPTCPCEKEDFFNFSCFLQSEQSFYENIFLSSRTGDKGAGAGTLVNPRTRGDPLDPQQLLRPSGLELAPTLGFTNVSPSLWASRNRRLGQNSPRPQLRCLKSGVVACVDGTYVPVTEFFLREAYNFLSVHGRVNDGLAEFAPGRFMWPAPERGRPSGGGAIEAIQPGVASKGHKGAAHPLCPEIVKRCGQTHLLTPVWEDREIINKGYCSNCWRKKEKRKDGSRLAGRDDKQGGYCPSDKAMKMVSDATYTQKNKSLIIITPETFYPFSLNNHPEQVALWSSVIPDNAYVIIGSQLTTGHKFYQAAYLMQNSLIKKYYVKHHCTPFVEKIPKLWKYVGPLREVFLHNADEFSRGKQLLSNGMFDVGVDIRLIPQICSEFFFTTRARAVWDVYQGQQDKKQGIVFLINDSWFVGYFQRILKALATLKAAYFGLPVIYVGHSGYWWF